MGLPLGEYSQRSIHRKIQFTLHSPLNAMCCPGLDHGTEKAIGEQIGIPSMPII